MVAQMSTSRVKSLVWKSNLACLADKYAVQCKCQCIHCERRSFLPYKNMEFAGHIEEDDTRSWNPDKNDMKYCRNSNITANNSEEEEDYLELGLLMFSQSTWIRVPMKYYICKCSIGLLHWLSYLLLTHMTCFFIEGIKRKLAECVCEGNVKHAIPK